EQAGALVSGMTKADPVRQTSPAELMEARLALEPAILEMVIGNATASDFEEMDACCERAEAATTLEDFEHWDGMLHEVIAVAAHNSFVSNVFQVMNQVRNQGEWGVLKKRSVTPERRLQYQAEHRQLVEALKRRDVHEARAVATEHLLRVQRNLLRPCGPELLPALAQDRRRRFHRSRGERCGQRPGIRVSPSIGAGCSGLPVA
ncbi:MAG TPA: FCD domain-containing protein, partial [Ramlibacter sp.]